MPQQYYFRQLSLERRRHHRHHHLPRKNLLRHYPVTKIRIVILLPRPDLQ